MKDNIGHSDCYRLSGFNQEGNLALSLLHSSLNFTTVFLPPCSSYLVTSGLVKARGFLTVSHAPGSISRGGCSTRPSSTSPGAGRVSSGFWGKLCFSPGRWVMAPHHRPQQPCPGPGLGIPGAGPESGRRLLSLPMGSLPVNTAHISLPCCLSLLVHSLTLDLTGRPLSTKGALHSRAHWWRGAGGRRSQNAGKITGCGQQRATGHGALIISWGYEEN